MSIQSLTRLRIVPIFASREQAEGLYACWYEHRDQDELSHLFELWNDPNFVRKQCRKNQQRIGVPPLSMDVNEAVAHIWEEIEFFNDLLLPHQNTNRYQPAYTHFLNDFFEPLDTKHVNNRYKAKATISGLNLLRLYALDIRDGLFLVTGGGMKFTRTMQQDPYNFLQQELDKLDKVADLLQKRQVDETHFTGEAFSIP